MAEESEGTARRLFVGGLPFETSEGELEEAFSKAGEVESAAIITDRNTGRSRGFGFVEFSSEEDGQAAIDMWDGEEFGGRTLTVNVARPRQ